MNLFRSTFIAAALSLAACAQLATAQVIHVTKTASCGCCTGWIDHLRAEGFEVRVTNVEDVTPVARRLGIPDHLRSCHSAAIAGYALEGHVPAADIRRLLAERPAGAAGIAVPGMPIGSPGMEQGDRREPYQTILFTRDGRQSVFAQH